MALTHFYATANNKETGRPLDGVLVELVSGGTVQTIYSDRSLTPKPQMITGLGYDAVTGVNLYPDQGPGEANCYVEEGNYDVRYTYNGVVIDIQPDFPVFGSTSRIAAAEAKLTWFTPEQFGATGGTASADITANNTAFAALNAALTAAGGGVVEMHPGRTYVVGSQTANSGGFRFNGTSVLYGQNLSYFIVRGNGAVLKLAPGLYFGGYTSAVPPVATTNPANGDPAQRADQGHLIRASGCDLVHVENVFLDGNAANGIVGGPWADTGRQCISYGIHIFECDNVVLDAVTAYDWLLDGFAVGYTGLTASSDIKPMILSNCVSQRSARNCISIVGGNGIKLDNCYFEDAGNAVNTVFGRVKSDPAAACDWESELSVIRSGVADNCSFYSGLYGNTAVVAGSGDTRGIRFNNCRFDGNIFMQKPEIIFDGGVLNGQFGALQGGATRRSDNTIVRNMTGSDVALSGRALEGNQFITGSSGNGANVVIEGCDFTLSVSKLNIREFIVPDTRVTFTCGTDTFANQDFVVLAEGAIMTNVVFIDSAGTTASDPPTANEGYFVALSSATIAKNCSIVPSANFTLKWQTWSAGGGGTPTSSTNDGRYNRGVTDIFEQYLIQKAPTFGAFNGHMTVRADTASPTVGTMSNGSWVYNSDPANGEPLGWNVVGGSAVASGIVGGVQCAAQADFAGADVTALKVELNAFLAKLRTSNLLDT